MVSSYYDLKKKLCRNICFFFFLPICFVSVNPRAVLSFIFHVPRLFASRLHKYLPPVSCTQPLLRQLISPIFSASLLLLLDSLACLCSTQRTSSGCWVLSTAGVFRHNQLQSVWTLEQDMWCHIFHVLVKHCYILLFWLIFASASTEAAEHCMCQQLMELSDKLTNVVYLAPICAVNPVF